jgi:glycosyltransferase involved in cell wall biosynthesis
VLLARFRTYHAADLLIVGTGVNETELREGAKGLPHIHFLGWIEQHQLRELYRRAIAVLVPSLCDETFGLVLIEAFAARTPVIVHARGALPEVVHTQ